LFKLFPNGPLDLTGALVEQDNLRLYVDAQFASPYAMSAFVALSGVVSGGASQQSKSAPGASLASQRSNAHLARALYWACVLRFKGEAAFGSSERGR